MTAGTENLGTIDRMMRELRDREDRYLAHQYILGWLAASADPEIVRAAAENARRLIEHDRAGGATATNLRNPVTGHAQHHHR